MYGFHPFHGIAAAAAVLAALFAAWHYEYGTVKTVTFTVRQLDDQATGSGHKYLVFTADGRVFKNTDSYPHLKFDSSNVQAMLQAGHTYTCPVYGFRLPLFSGYQDILDGCRETRAGDAAS